MDNWIKIENRQNWLTEIPILHPDSTSYINYWREQKKYCIEGFWGKDFGQYRYLPATAYFYVNFCRILDVDRASKTRRSIKPLLRDVEWELSYMMLEAKGFSGWMDDNQYTSLLDVEKYEKNEDEKLLKLLKTSKDNRGNLVYVHAFIDGDINNPLKKFKPVRDNIRQLHNKPLGAPLYTNNSKNVITLGCLDAEQGVRMYDGSIKNAIDIAIGDKLMGIDSTPRVVKELVRGEAPMYKVQSRYGNPYTVSFSHLLHLQKRKYKKVRNHNQLTPQNIDISINDYLNIPEKERKTLYQGVMSNAIEYNKKDLNWDPYLLGLWLGDGFKARKMVCGSYDDYETLEWLKKHIDNHPNYTSYKITEYTGQLGKKPLWRFSWIDKTMLYKNNWFAKTLFKNKHIPSEYLNTSLQDRLELLAGMIDSDGCLDGNKRRFTITNIDLNLLKQFQEVARSCGFRAVINKPSKSGVTNSLKYNLRITGEISKIPTKLSRKKADNSTLGMGSNKNDIQVTPVGVKNFYGFEVDKDHLFLLEDYTITHNSRGSGKSYYFGLAEALHAITFDGAKYYTQSSIDKPDEIHINIGSEESNKSSELCEKIELCMNAFGTDSELGVWGDESSDEYFPMPFYKAMSGTLGPNNAKTPWIHRYEKNTGGKWLKYGTKSKIVHSIYKSNPTAAAGGRYVLMVDEECGLHSDIITTHNSNIACCQAGATKFGVQAYIGTSGDIEKVRGSRKLMTDPDSYDIVSYDDIWENSGKVGFFIPAYYANNDFKDENGNTDVEAAYDYYLQRRIKAKKSKDSHNIEGEMMNYPIKPSEMFLTRKGNILPIGELEEHRGDLLKDRNRKLHSVVGTLIFDKASNRGVKFLPDLEGRLSPITEYPTPKNQDVEGAFVCYERPIEDYTNGQVVVPAIYGIGMDPVESDTEGLGLSMSCFYVFKMPRNTKKYGGNEVVAEFIGRPHMGRDAVNELMEKAAMWYGIQDRMINFERGGNVKEYFQKKNKLNLLMVEPKTVFSNKSGSTSKMLMYGTVIKSFEQKFEAILLLRDWLLEEYGVTEDGTIIRNLNLIKSMRLIEEMIAFDFEGNFDSVMAFAECIILLKEKYNQYNKQAQDEVKPDTILDFLNKSMANKAKNLNY